jgi:DNA relaxase NicK
MFASHEYGGKLENFQTLLCQVKGCINTATICTLCQGMLALSLPLVSRDHGWHFYSISCYVSKKNAVG